MIKSRRTTSTWSLKDIFSADSLVYIEYESMRATCSFQVRVWEYEKKEKPKILNGMKYEDI
jgi:hypothetical protein